MVGGGPSGWPSDWNIYYIVVLAGALALLIPIVLWVISRALSQPNTSGSPSSAQMIRGENPAENGRKSNPRIFQALNAALILIVLAH